MEYTLDPVTWQFKRFGRSPYHVIDRRTTWFPLLRQKKKLETTGQLTAGARIIADKWRECLKRLLAMKAISATQYSFAVNCPPTGGYAQRGKNGAVRKRCRLSRVCPWCWSRDIARRSFNPIWNGLKALGVPPYRKDDITTHQQAIRLISIRRKGKRHDSPEGAFREMGEAMDDEGAELKRLKPKGLVQTGAVTFSSKGFRAMWGCAIIADDACSLKGLKTKYAEHKARMTRELSRYGVVEMLWPMVRYGYRMMDFEEKAARLLKCRPRIRAFRTYGVCHGQCGSPKPGTTLDEG